MSGQATFSSGVANQSIQSHHTQRIGGDGEEVGIERPIQVPLTVVANNQPAPNYDYEFDPSNHLMSSQFDEDPIPPNHVRSETIGSDTFVDDVPADNATGKIGAATLLKPSHTHHSDSDVASDSVPQDLDRNLGRKEELSPPELKKRVRGNRYETRRNKYQIDDEESIDEDERKRDERDRDSRYWGDRGRMPSESFREPERRDRGERYRNDNHNDDWDSRSRNSTRYYNRGYGDDFDDSMSRPRSRNRYYGREQHDDYYRYRPHDRYNDFRRQEELEHQYRLRRERLAESLMYTPARANYNAMDVRRHMEDLRLRNPAVYRDWYNKYLAHMRNPTQIPFPSLPGYGAIASMETPSTFGPAAQDPYSNNPMDLHFNSISSDRQSESEVLPFGPGAGGYSNDSEVEKFLRNPTFPSVIETTPARNTPLKFRNSHSFAIFTPQGQLLRVKGAAGTTIEISGVRQYYQHLPEVKELELFPGPLVKGSTHKNTLIQFCQRKIQEISLHKREGDSENFILLWEVLVLLLKHNGNVVGSDISELLLETANKQDSCRDIHRLVTKIDTDGSEADDTSQSDSVERKKETGLVQPEKSSKEEITQHFCQLLLFGHRKDALDYAMNNDLWGHALFLSSKLDERTHSHVLTRFSAVLPTNHPLQTLYQMLSGRQPSSVTNCIDDSYGDWRPHLAMILSNSGFRHEVENKAIISLGDTLGFKNQLFAAQFCYLMAQLDFSSKSKLGPLMGYTTQHKNVIEATQMTEIYEFAKSLADPNFSLGTSFMERKLNYMNTLIDYGFLLEAYSYCEEIAKKLLSSNCDNIVHTAFESLIQVGERLKHFCEDPSLVTPPWITSLKERVSWGGENGDINSLKDLTIADTQSGPTEYEGNENVVQQNNVYDSDRLHYETTSMTSNQPAEYIPNGLGLIQDPYAQPPLMGTYQNANDAVDHGRRASNELQTAPNMFDISSVPFHQSNSSSTTSNNNQPPPYVSNNNNYYQPQPAFDYDSPMGGNYNRAPSVPSTDLTNLNDKKKSVRFDEERLRNRSKINHSEKTPVELSMHRILENKSTEIKSALKSKQNVRDEGGKVTPTSPTPSLKFNQPDKEKVNLNSPLTNSSNVKFNDTFPIDEPSSLRPSLPSTIVNNFSTSRIKTFPIDKKCCDVQQPCLEHDIYQSGNSASAAPCSCINPFEGYNNKTDNQTVNQFQQSNAASKRGSNSQPSKAKSSDNLSGKPKADQTSWIGGLLSKLKPKGQMILPEDKSPTIVWDPVKKDWVNTNEDESETSVRAGPPPKDSDLRRPEDNFAHPANPPSSLNPAPNQMMGNIPPMNSPVNSSFADPSPGSGPNMFNANGVNAMNKYKLPKGSRNNYVDVFNPGGQSQKPISPLGGPGNGVMGVPSFFVPPIAAADSGPVSFLTAPTENPLMPEDSMQEGNYATN